MAKKRTTKKSSAKSSTKAVETQEVEVTWKAGFRKSGLGQAKDVYDEIETIRNINGGVITSDVLVKEAKGNDVLNPFFTWDDKKCAQDARRAEAGSLMRSIHVRYIQIERTDLLHAQPARAYEIDRTKWTGSGTRKPYRSVEEIMADPVAKDALLARAFSELVAFRSRFRGLQELAILFREIDSVLESTDL